MNNIFLFAGQGSQFLGMGHDLYNNFDIVKKLFSEINELSGKKWEKIIFDGSDIELSETVNSQPAITLLNIALSQVLAEQGIRSIASAGFSLGEFSALVDAGILNKEDAFRIVLKRAAIMQLAADKLKESGDKSGMAAVMGLPQDKVEELLSTVTDVYPANFNSPVQTVISGTDKGLSEAEVLLKENGARRVIRLKVSGAFHSPLMEEANNQFIEELNNISFHSPNNQYYSSVSGDLETDAETIKNLIKIQMIRSVQWTKVEGHILNNNFQPVEIGPGSVLAGLWRAFSKETKCISVLSNMEESIKELKNV